MFDSQRPYIIAELSGNHNGSVEQAKILIKAAAENGADCVKLQTYTPDTMTIQSSKPDFQVKGGLWDGYSLWDLYKWAHTPFEWHAELFEYAKECGITCISTPFDETAVDLLEDLDCPFYKIASFELTDLPLVAYVAQKKKPMILSTGMANQQEIEEAVEVVRSNGCDDFVLLHCVSGYPTPAEQMNLATIPLLKKTFGCAVGLSDHSLGNTAAVTSIALGATVIEKHFTMRREDGGPDSSFSMEPEELLALRKEADIAAKAYGEGSFRMKQVEQGSMKFRRSLYVVKDMAAGEEFTSANLRRIRPGYGLAPKFYDGIIGKKATQKIEAGTALSEELVEGFDN